MSETENVPEPTIVQPSTSTREDFLRMITNSLSEFRISLFNAGNEFKNEWTVPSEI